MSLVLEGTRKPREAHNGHKEPVVITFQLAVILQVMTRKSMDKLSVYARY